MKPAGTDWETSKLISTHLTEDLWINFFINPGGTSVGTSLRQGISKHWSRTKYVYILKTKTGRTHRESQTPDAQMMQK